MIAKNEDAEILLNKIIKLEEIRNDAQKLVILADGSLQEFNANNLPILFTLRLLDKIPRTQATSTVAEYASLTAADCITNDDCICKRPLDEASRGNLISVRDATTANDPLENFMKCKDVLTPAYGIKTLGEAWGQIDQDIFDARRDVMEANRDIKETNNKLEIKTEDLKGEIDEARQGLFQVKKDIEEHERNARTWKSMKMQSEADYRKEMAEVSKLDRTPEIQEADACIKRTDQFIAAIDTVKDIVIGEQKTRIEDRASEIIGNVARTTMNVSGIKLDDKYTIMIESAGTGELRYTTDPPRPSKGQKQILGQSFVLALTRFAGFERPMFIDSPFMRLDSDYTTKIAEQLVEQDSQVMVLYQPDELKPGTGTQGARDGIEILKASAASEWEFTSVSEVETTITQVI
jgi:DNA sulfur modification protein DndD